MNHEKNRRDDGEAMPATHPDWYWSRGLHDAEIKGIHELEFSPDWKASEPRWNCLELVLDSRGAMFETDIRQINFFNYKILSGDPDRLREPHTWWFSDKPETDEKGYRLTVTFESSHGDRFELQIRFEEALVERKAKKNNGDTSC